MTFGACYEAIVPVGKSCDCGHPLIWMRGTQRCAVYGSHPAPDDLVYFRNSAAPGAHLVELCMQAPGDRRRPRLKVVV